MSALPALPQPAVADQGVALARLHAFSFLPSRHWHPARVAPWQDELQALLNAYREGLIHEHSRQ